MQLRKRNVVPGRYNYMARLSPQTAFNPTLILTKTRRGMITAFKRVHPFGFTGSHWPHSEAWAKDLTTFMSRRDNKIELRDIKRWIKNHAWISQISENSAPSIVSPELPGLNSILMTTRDSVSPMLLRNDAKPSGYSSRREQELLASLRTELLTPLNSPLETVGQNLNLNEEQNIMNGPSTSNQARDYYRRHPANGTIPDLTKTKTSSVPNSSLPYAQQDANNNSMGSQTEEPTLPISPLPDSRDNSSEDFHRALSPDLMPPPSGHPRRRIPVRDHICGYQCRQRKTAAGYAKAFDYVRRLSQFCEPHPSLRVALIFLRKFAKSLSRSNLKFVSPKTRAQVLEEYMKKIKVEEKKTKENTEIEDEEVANLCNGISKSNEVGSTSIFDNSRRPPVQEGQDEENIDVVN